MPKNFERYINLRRAIQDWIIGQGSADSIAPHLNLTASSLQELFTWNGISDVTGRPNEGIDVQDVFNLVFYIYSQKNREVLREQVLKR